MRDLKKNSIDIEALKECLVRGKYTTVPRTDYFRLLVAFDVETFTDDMSYSVWEEFHSRRGDNIQIRTLYLRKLLETQHEESKNY